jgi:hypothetical protein
MKNNRIWRILLILLVAYHAFDLFKYFHPTFYGTSFNNKRIEIGLMPIDSNLVRTKDKTSVYQIWKNESDTVPRFYTKYVSCGKWNGGIDMEYDSFVVVIDSTKAIISINYIFESKSFDYWLKEYERSKNTFEVYGHSGKKIRTLDKTEATEILNKNGIKY